MPRACLAFIRFPAVIRSAIYLIRSPLIICTRCWHKPVGNFKQTAIWRSIKGHLLIALDGTDTFRSEKIHCPCCSQQTLKNGNLLYRHTVVTPVIVAPGQPKVIPLPPEFVQPQDGSEKQDCEIAASKRWLAQWGAQYSRWGSTLLGDERYQQLRQGPFSRKAFFEHLRTLVLYLPFQDWDHLMAFMLNPESGSPGKLEKSAN